MKAETRMYPDFRLGPRLVQPSLNSISHNGIYVRLEPKAMEVLVCLAQNGGSVVSKEKLIAEVWPDTFVGDDVLVRCISELRRALEDDAKAPLVIETIPKRGYRLLEKVEPVSLPGPGSGSVLLRRVAAVAITIAILVGVYRTFLWVVRRPPLTIKRLTTTGRVGLVAISRDGKFLAYSEDYLNAQTLWLREIATDTSVQLQPSAPASYKSLAFSANGDYLYYTRSAPGNSFEASGDTFDLFRIPIVGRTPEKLRQNMPENFSISPDGKSVAFVRTDRADNESIVVAAIDGSSEREFANLHSPLSYRAGPTWSPDGKLIAAVEDPSTTLFQCRLLVVAAEDGSQKMRTDPDLKYCMEQSQWLSDGRGLIAPFPLPHWQLWEFTYPQGAARRITYDSVRYGLVSLPEDPHSIVTVENDLPSSIWVGPGNDPDSANAIRHGHFLAIHGIGWTPSGEILSSTIATDTEDFVQMRSDGSDERTLPFQASTKRWPEVCSDGRTLLFHEFYQGASTLMRADLSGFKLEPIVQDVSNSGSRCSPDSKWVVYIASGKLWKRQLSGGQAILLSDKPCDFPSISHDGRWIACHYWPERASSLKLVILSFDGSSPERTLDLPDSMSEYDSLGWTPDDRAIAFIDRRSGVGNLWIQPLSGESPHALTHFRSEGVLDFAWSLDGSRIAITRGDGTSDAVMITNF